MWQYPVDEVEQDSCSLPEALQAGWVDQDRIEYPEEFADMRIRSDESAIETHRWETQMDSLNRSETDEYFSGIFGPSHMHPAHDIDIEPSFEEWYRQRLERLRIHQADQLNLGYEPELYQETMDQYQQQQQDSFPVPRAGGTMSCGSSTASGPITMVSGTPSDTISVHSAAGNNPPAAPAPAPAPAPTPNPGPTTEQQYLAALLEAHKAAFASIANTPAELVGQVTELMKEDVALLPDDWEYVLVKISDDQVRYMEREAFEQAWTFAAYILAIKDGHFDQQAAWDTLKRMQLGAAVSDVLCRRYLENQHSQAESEQSDDLAGVPLDQQFRNDEPLLQHQQPSVETAAVNNTERLNSLWNGDSLFHYGDHHQY